MKNPEGLKYSKSHEWVAFMDDNTAKIGLTDYAQDSLGSLVFINLPEEGDTVEAGEALGDVESVKAVSDVLSPLNGTVSAINEALLDAPENINSDPYGSWLITVTDYSGGDELMSVAEYEALCKESE